MKELARVFKALADETRLKILALIMRGGELCVCDCMKVLDITQSRASRHLRYLANAGLLEDRKEAVWVYYRLSSDVDDSREIITEALAKLFTEERMSFLYGQLDRWNESKKENGPSCSS